ncbi:hypothetical protein ACFL6C_06005 [Myxococcota bacterium]
MSCEALNPTRVHVERNILSLFAIVTSLAVATSTRAAGETNRPASVCVRALDIGGLSGNLQAKLRTDVVANLARHEVRVAVFSDKPRSSWCRPRGRGPPNTKGVVFVEFEALRVGPLVQMSLSVFRDKEKQPSLRRKWSVPLEKALAGTKLAESLEEVAFLAHRQVGDHRKRTLPSLPSFPPLADTDTQSSQATVPKKDPEGPDSSPAAASPEDPEVSPSEAAAASPADPEVSEPPERTVAAGQGQTLRVSSYFVMGAGAIGLGLGAGFGIKALVHRQRAGERSTGAQLEIPRMEESQTIANWSFLAGGVTAATGLVLWLLADDDPPAASVALQTGRGTTSVVVVGTF